MRNNENSPRQSFDFSEFDRTISRIREMVRPVMEAMENFRSFMFPIVETIEKYKSRIIAIGQTLEEATRALAVIEKMGDAQFVYWDYMTDDFIDTVVDADNINKLLREHLLRDRFHSVNNTIDKTLSSPVLQKHKRLYFQSVKAFRNGDSDLAVTGLTSVFDVLLTEISGNPTSSLKARVEAIKKKLENEELLDHDEYAMITLALTLERTLDYLQRLPRVLRTEKQVL